MGELSPTMAFALMNELTETKKAVLRLEDEKAALVEALSELVLYHDVPSEAQDPVVRPLLRAAFAAIDKATGQEGAGLSGGVGYCTTPTPGGFRDSVNNSTTSTPPPGGEHPQQSGGE
jgi:hypothetical protein